jgi:hypothetical protein
MANIFTNVGKQIVTGRLLSAAPGGGTPGSASPQFIGWGTGAGTAAIADTTLFTEDYSTTNTGTQNTRVTGTTTQFTTTTTSDTLQVQGTVTANAIKTITNAGVFDTNGIAANLTTAPSGGNLFVKSDFTGIALQANDSIQFTFRWQLT